jgi:hypothetical protein
MLESGDNRIVERHSSTDAKWPQKYTCNESEKRGEESNEAYQVVSQEGEERASQNDDHPLVSVLQQTDLFAAFKNHLVLFIVFKSNIGIKLKAQAVVSLVCCLHARSATEGGQKGGGGEKTMIGRKNLLV